MEATLPGRTHNTKLTDRTVLAAYLPLIGVAMVVAKLFEIPGQASTWYPPAGVMLSLFVVTTRATRLRAAAVALIARVAFDAVLYPTVVRNDLRYEVLLSIVVCGVFLGVSFLIDRLDVAHGNLLHFGRFVLFAVVGGPTVIAIGAAILDALTGGHPTLLGARTFAIGDAVGVATVVPLSLVARNHMVNGTRSRRPFRLHDRPHRGTELLLQSLALIVVPTATVAVGRNRTSVVWILAILPIVWIALRQSLLVTTAAVAVTNLVIAVAARRVLGRTNGLVDAQILLLTGTIAAGYVATVVRLQQRRLDERTERERQIARIARTDPLTGLHNRNGFLQAVGGTTPLAVFGETDTTKGTRPPSFFAPGRPISVIVADIERFSEVIDGLGAAVGDAVLLSVATRLTDLVGATGVVARLEGDTFAMAVPTGKPAAAMAVAQEALERIQSEPFTEGLGLYLTARAGVATEAASNDPDETLRNATIALRTAKAGHQRRPVAFTEHQRAEAVENRSLLSALRNAIDHDAGQLGLLYQPIFSAADREIVGAEALLRWTHPEFGVVHPARFIPLAERSGLMHDLGDLVMRKAISQLGVWSAIVPNTFHLHVNVSPTQLADDELPARLASACSAANASAASLTLELTETALGTDPHASMGMLERLRSVGPRISLDDFGTGFSTIGWLSKFPIDELKIDQSFVAGLPDRRDDVAIVRLILGLARELSLVVTAEGVERPEQLAALRTFGCQQVQGYLFARPMPADELTQQLRAPRRPLLITPAENGNSIITTPSAAPRATNA